MIKTNDPGLGSKFQRPVHRLMNPDGTYNIVRKGGLNGIRDFYKFLLEIKWYWFLLLISAFYFVMNVIFASLYLTVGIEQLHISHGNQSDFFDAFFFSSQTFTTVGYGSISPKGKAAEVIAMVEAFFGLLSFALATGLLYGRFSKPSLRLNFSKNILITPFEGGTALMFKLVNLRSNVLLNTKIKTLFIIDKGEGFDEFNKSYFNLELETAQVNFFPLTWTVVHKINSESPLYNLSLEELKRRNAEVVIMVETFEETFGQIIIQKHSYAQEQWLEGKKFDKNFRMDDNGKLTLYIDELDNMVDVDYTQYDLNAPTENEIKPGQNSNPKDKNQSSN
jgi:inward rectifier potassium channel